jgi:tRNA (mo5U34)-methyltransferase
MPGSDEVGRIDAETRRQIAELDWFHSIDLGDGVITPGSDDSRAKLARLGLPEDLSGMSVLDIGAYDGFFAFEAERRGASRVLAIDTLAWERGARSGWPCFRLAHRVLNSRVEAKKLDVAALSREMLGGFDVVLLLGVLYHLEDPMAGLRAVADVTDGLLVVETHTDANRLARPAMAFYPTDELNDDPSNWWGPNEAALLGILRAVGFDHTRVVYRRPWLLRAARAIGRGIPKPTRMRSLADQGRVVMHARRRGPH